MIGIVRQGNLVREEGWMRNLGEDEKPSSLFPPSNADTFENRTFHLIFTMCIIIHSFLLLIYSFSFGM